MKAVGYKKSLPIHHAESLLDIEVPTPSPAEHDLLVKVFTIAVNPVDCKVRKRMEAEADTYKILGWDAVGEVVETGAAVKNFKPGDIVYYAGDITRQGSNAEYQVVSEYIVGKKPQSLSHAEAAALPLTTITAWELLFHHLSLPQQTPEKVHSHGEVLLVVGAAGGVGSILVQLAKKLTGATVIGTASRKESREWAKTLGADHIIDPTQSLPEQIRALGIPHITHVASLTHTDSYFEDYIDLLVPFGKIGMIDDAETLDVMKIKNKSLSLHIEFMFARSMHNAKDKIEQSNLLNYVATLIDQGHLKTTVGTHLGTICAKNLKQAHETLESGRAIGKIVLEGF